jgi:hypothetical protein
VVLEQVKDINEFTTPKDSSHPMGWMIRDRWEETVSFIKKAYKLEGDVKASNMYINEFLQ